MRPYIHGRQNLIHIIDLRETVRGLLRGHRYVAKLPTVITTSVSPDDLDPRIRTRILDETCCLIFPIIAPSYRGGQPARPAAAAPKPARQTRRR